jgi:hypothetical protein
MKLTVHSSPFSCYLLILGQNMFLITLLSNTISLHLSLKVQDLVPFPYKQAEL